MIMAVVLGFLLLGMAALYNLYLSRDRLTTTIENQLEKALGHEAHIRAAEIDIIKGLSIRMTGLEIGTGSDLMIRAERVSAKISPWHLAIGKIRIAKIIFLRPDVIVRYTRKPLQTADGGGVIPAFDIQDGNITILYKDSSYHFNDLTGRFGRHRANFVATALGGEGKFSLIRIGKFWQAEATIRNINPQEPPDRIRPLFPAEIELKATGTDQTASVTELGLTTQVFTLNGRAKLHNYRSRDERRLDLDLHSSQFDFEEFVGILPTEAFPRWMEHMLTRQVRSGRSTFRAIEYHGPVKEMANFDAFARNIRFYQELNGQSFGAGFDNERISDIHGALIIADGDVRFENLTGRIGNSAIERMDISFADAVAPGTRLTVDLDADMAATDFVRGWRAMMTSRSLYEQLDPVTEVTAGRIKGNLSTYWDSAAPGEILLRADMQSSNCNFKWQDHQLRDISGSMLAEEFRAPVKIDLSGIWDGIPLSRFSMILLDTTSAPTYRYHLETDRIPDLDFFALSADALITLEGRGKGPLISGRIDSTSAGFDLFGTSYRSAKDRLTTQANLSGSLWNGFRLNVTDLSIKLPSGRLVAAADFHENGGRFELKGRTVLKGLEAITKAGAARAIGGTIAPDFNLQWGLRSALKGRLKCEDAVLFLGGKPCAITGTVNMADDRLSASGLSIRTPGFAVVLTGNYFHQRKAYYGSLLIDGLEITKQKSMQQGPSFPDDFSGEADLKLRDMKIYDLPTRETTARAVLDENGLTLRDMTISADDGTLTGSFSYSRDGGNAFDISGSFRNADMVRIIEALTNEPPIINGSIDVDGHLWGTSQSINGNINFTARKGEIVRYGLLSKIFGALNVYKFIKTGEIILTREGFPYNHITGTFDISDSLVQFDDLHVDSNSVQFSSVGEYSFRTKQIDALVGVQPLETLDKTISIIPLLGWVLTGPEGRLLVISLKVKGSLDDPSVVPAPIDTISKPVAGTLLRIMKLPVDLLTQPQKLILPSGISAPEGKGRPQPQANHDKPR